MMHRARTILAAWLVLTAACLCAAPTAAAVQGKSVTPSKESTTLGGVRRAIRPEEMSAQDRRMLELAEAAAKECSAILERAIDRGIKSEEEFFSALYFPVLPVTTPATFTTFYDDYTDKFITPIEDRYLSRDKDLLFVALVDANGYVPSHNSKYAQPATGDPQLDLKRRRTKRIFNDITGFFAVKHTQGALIQLYRRDTGEIVADLSVPVTVKGRYWGALRVGYARKS